MASPLVFVYAPAKADHGSYAELQSLGCELLFGNDYWQEKPDPKNQREMIAMAAGCDAMHGGSIRNTPITREVLEASETLRIVAKYSIGVDEVDLEAATELGILVTNAPTEANWGSVAEGTMAMMLALYKRVRERDAYIKEGNWRKEELIGTYVGSRADGYPGLTVGLIGLGRVGGRFAELLRPWRVQLLVYDPYIPDERFREYGARRVDLETLLRESDVVSMHVVLTPETHHMIGPAEFDLMKPTAVFLNTARGKVVDEKALVDALLQDKIWAAGIDAFEQEPPPPDSPIRKLGHRVLLSPHYTFVSRGGGLEQGVRIATDAVTSSLRGQLPDEDCIYNREAIPRWLERFGGRPVRPVLP